MSFTARRISLPDGQAAWPRKLVYGRDEFTALCDIAAAVDRARRAASAIVQDARKTAEMLEVRSEAANRSRVRDVEAALVVRARALEEAYRFAHAALTTQLEATLDAALAAALERIAAGVPAAERLRIVGEQLAQAAGPVSAAHLRMGPADGALYRDAQIRSPWTIQIDDALARGQCQLVTETAQWALDFDALIASLGAATRE